MEETCCASNNNSVRSLMNNNSCPVCAKECFESCGACKKVNYCSREHQKNDWRAHKSDCFPAVIETNDEVGRHLVATRDIAQGEIIFKEKPLVCGPLAKADCFPVCLSCFKIVRTDYKCSRCKWAVCDVKCENNPQHADFECKIFKDRLPPAGPTEATIIYEKIIVLRGVLCLQQDPVTWDKISRLESHFALRRQDHNSRVMSQTTIAFIRVACGLKDIDDKTIEQVLGSVIVNAFVSDDSISSADLYRFGSYLYFWASIPAHNCTPNSSWVIQANSEFVIRASVPIKCGESITQLYAQPTLGTLLRRQHLKESKFFSCACKRCSDPTELGTMFSAVKCPVCPEGYLLLENPLMTDDDEEEGDDGCPVNWKCNSSACQRIIPEAFVDDVLYSIEGDPKMCVDSGEESLNSSLKAIGVLEKLIKTHSGKTVHENHYLIHSLENDLLQRLSFLLASEVVKNESEKVDMANRMTVLARKCIAMADILWPGYNRHRGRLLYLLQQSLTIPLKRFVSQKRPKKLTEEKMTQLKAQLQEILDLRKMAHTILSIEPVGREENLIATLCLNNSEDIQNLKKMFHIT